MKAIRRFRIIALGSVFAFIAIFMTLYEHLTLVSSLSNGAASSYHLHHAIIINIISGCFGGMVTGVTLNYIDSKYRNKSFCQSLILVILIFLAVWIVRTIILGFTISEKNHIGFDWIFEAEDLRDIVFWSVMVMLAHIFLQMSNKFGPGKLIPVFTGKYDRPSEERRIFMMLDLKASTTIAERLGHIKYHLFLKKVFSDITNPILKAQGEIYQYVGDEIVISWSVNKANGNPRYAECFFNIQAHLEEKKEDYLDEFGVLPIFKAGAHLGQVIAGEIGLVKRDITYSGDVLNTAARIQGLCNQLESKLLISQHLYNFSSRIDDFWDSKVMGSIPLKGKSESLNLIGLSRK